MPWQHLTPGKDPVPVLQEARWASGPVWTGAENLAPTRIRSPYRPVLKRSLYRLSYPAPCGCQVSEYDSSLNQQLSSNINTFNFMYVLAVT